MDPPSPVSQDMLLGEMRGQLRELVHSVNNLSGKFDGLTREVIGLSAFATTVAKTEVTVEKLEARVKAVEDTDSRQAGERGLVEAFLKSPLVGWLVGAAVTIWLLLSGKAPQ